jgi:hypothetical protein
VVRRVSTAPLGRVGRTSSSPSPTRTGGRTSTHRDATYDKLTRDHFTYEVARRAGDQVSPYEPVQGNPVNVCLRQIAHEVLVTLSLEFPAVLAARAD